MMSLPKLVRIVLLGMLLVLAAGVPYTVARLLGQGIGPPVVADPSGVPAPVAVVPPAVAPAAIPAPRDVPAVLVQEMPASPASPNHMPEQITWALAMSYIYRYVNNKGWLGANTTKRVKVVIGGVVATLTAVGIHIGVDGSFFGTAGASVTITGLSWDALKDIGFQWVSQEAWYDTIVRKAGASPPARIA